MGLLDDSQEFALLLIYILTTLAAVATILRLVYTLSQHRKYELG